MRIIAISMLILLSACYKTENTTKKPEPLILTGSPETIVKGGWRKMGTFFNNVNRVTYLFTAKEKAYVMIGGYQGPDGTDFYEYDPSTNTFTPKATLPVKDWDNTGWGMSINGKGYYGAINQFWEYDDVNDAWVKRANFPKEKVTRPGVFGISNKGYLCGYQDKEGYRNDDTTYEFDPVNNTWSKILDYAVIGSTSERISNVSGNRPFMTVKKIRPDNTLLVQVLEYSVDSNWWIYRSKFPEEKMPLCSWANKDSGYFLADDCKTIWVMNPNNYKWSNGAEFPGQARILPQGFAIGEKFYIGFGDAGNLEPNALNDLWEYNP